MHSVVCIKQVPDSAQIRVHPVTNTIMRQGVPAIINPYDTWALEAALALRDRLGGEVTVLSMGPPMAEDALRRALSIGADRAVLLTDRFFAGSDTLATSFALATAISKIAETWGKPGIVFTGKQTIDGDTAQVGPGIAKRLDYVQLTYVTKIVEANAESGEIVVERRAEGGTQVLLSKLPVLMTMLEGEGDVRRGSLDSALRASRAEIIKWSAAQAGITDLSKCGLKGSPTVVKKVYAPSARAGKATLLGGGDAPLEVLADELVTALFAQAQGLESDLQSLNADQASAE
ncbi:MAG TPA: electron transfer flavoprotein subunit beta/FixA family protein [Polyangiales bacterium]|nr:electron transfer flavoprotein subunit beta/FixA family protein [Polyangiales bacterium]